MSVAVAAWLLHGNFTSSSVVATVTSTQGAVTRDFLGQEEQWSSAKPGEELRVGDAVKTSAQATAQLSLRDGATLSMEPDTVIRFSAQRPDGASDFRLEAGEAGLETSVGGVRIETAFGLLSLEGNSVVRIKQQGGASRLRVDMGRASFIDPSKAAQTMLPGDELTVERGKMPKLYKQKPDKKEEDEAEAGQPLLASTQLVDVELNGARDENERRPRLLLPPQPPRADVSIRAGESPTVHDTDRNTSARIRFERVCEQGEGVIEIGQKRGRFVPRAMGEEAASIALSPGVTRYRVRCIAPGATSGRVVASGTIRVVRDSAVRRVPLKPPSNMIDLDGRKYTVLYQNRLPSVVLRAPAAANGSRIVVRSGARSRTYELNGGAVTLSSGEIGDGTYEVAIEGAGKPLPSTVLRIAFDNAAPMASLDQQGTLLRDAAGHVHLSGVVPLGSDVSLEGQALTVDIVGRFAASALPSKNDSGVALRVAHPHAGIHYYVRNVTEEGP